MRTNLLLAILVCLGGCEYSKDDLRDSFQAGCEYGMMDAGSTHATNNMETCRIMALDYWSAR